MKYFAILLESVSVEFFEDYYYYCQLTAINTAYIAFLNMHISKSVM